MTRIKASPPPASNRKEQLNALGPGHGVGAVKTEAITPRRFRRDLSLSEYQKLRADLLLEMRKHPEQANAIYAMARDHRGSLPREFRKNFDTFLGLNKVSGMTQGALEWQRQLCTRQSSGDPEHPSLYDVRGLTDYQAYAGWGGDVNAMRHHVWGRGPVDLDRALTNSYRIPPELLLTYLADLDAASGLKDPGSRPQRPDRFEPARRERRLVAI